MSLKKSIWKDKTTQLTSSIAEVPLGRESWIDISGNILSMRLITSSTYLPNNTTVTHTSLPQTCRLLLIFNVQRISLNDFNYLWYRQDNEYVQNKSMGMKRNGLTLNTGKPWATPRWMLHILITSKQILKYINTQHFQKAEDGIQANMGFCLREKHFCRAFLNGARYPLLGNMNVCKRFQQNTGHNLSGNLPGDVLPIRAVGHPDQLSCLLTEW